jgi:hypothetical protein
MLVNGQNEENSVNEIKKVFSEKERTIEQILQHFYNDINLSVINLTFEPGSKEGDNYMSIIKRINVKFASSKNPGE